jgi:hypothetical protein
MKLVLCCLSFVLYFILSSCNANNEKNITKDHHNAIDKEFNQKLKNIFSNDASQYKKLKKNEIKLRTLIITYQQTKIGDAAFLETDSNKITILSESIKETSTINYFVKVLKFKKEHLVLFCGKSAIIHSSNRYILSYIKSNNEETLLTVLNINLNNTPCYYTNLIKCKLILCNYPTISNTTKGDSLLLRPFETRVYKLR